CAPVGRNGANACGPEHPRGGHHVPQLAERHLHPHRCVLHLRETGPPPARPSHGSGFHPVGPVPRVLLAPGVSGGNPSFPGDGHHPHRVLHRPPHPHGPGGRSAAPRPHHPH